MGKEGRVKGGRLVEKVDGLWMGKGGRIMDGKRWKGYGCEK